MNGARRTAKDGSAGWLVSRPFDLMFFANVWWLAALFPFFLTNGGEARLEFWQLYFLTVPHRWITLLLVATDSDRRDGREGLFVGIAMLALAVVAGIRGATGTFLCLLVVDYIWNAWHFGAQHYGILRIYSRRSGVAGGWTDRAFLRLFAVYVILRLAGWTTGWTESAPVARQTLFAVDGFFLTLVAATLVGETLRLLKTRADNRESDLFPRWCYLLSVYGLYGTLLFAVGTDGTAWVTGLAVASSAFHATEYLAIVSYYASRKRSGDGRGLFQLVAGQWSAFLLLYAAVLGAAAMVIDRHWAEIWLGVNVWAAFVHYAYDGLIWKLRKPATSQALAATRNDVPSTVTTGAADARAFSQGAADPIAVSTYDE